MLPPRYLPEQREWELTKQCSPPALPIAPVDLVAVAVDGCQVILAWTECGTGGLGYRVERADGIGPACPYLEIGSTGAHVAAFRDGAVKPCATYSYRVHARYASGDSPPCRAVELTMPPAGKGRPADKE